MAEDGDVGFEEGMSWLPTHVLDETCDSKTHLGHQQQQQHHRHRRNLPADPLPPHSKSSLKPHPKPRSPTIWATGGPGMQAIFLDSGQRSSGTGVFLPRRGGTDFQPSKKPACSPVLLPSRVIQALNLNVHALGLQTTPQRADLNNTPKRRNRNSVNNKNSKDVSMQCCVISQNQSSSPEIFLPKEWTY